MAKIKLCLSTLFFSFSVFYLIFSFVLLDLDVSNWTWGSRYFMVSFSCLLVLGVMIVDYLDNGKNDYTK